MNYIKKSMFGTALCLVVLGFSDTAVGQITTTPPLSSGMSFQVQSGGATASQNLTINTPNPTTVVVNVPSSAPWMTVAGVPAGASFEPNTPAALQVSVNTSGLTSGLTYLGTITINFLAGGNSSTLVSFQVALTVGTPSLLSANPATMSFSAISGATYGSSSSGTSVPVFITSSGQALNYNVSASTAGGSGNWLLLSNTQNISTSTSTAGFSVSVNPSALAVGTYTGLVTVQSTTTGDSATIAVTLVVTAGAVLDVTPTNLNPFVFQFGAGSGSFNSQTQNLMISTTSGSLNYEVQATNPTGQVQTTNWLVLGSTGGLATTSPQAVSLSLSYNTVATLPVGTYTITVVVSPTAGAGTPVSVVVTLIVSNHGVLGVNTNSLSFTIPFGSTNSMQQSVQLTSSNGTSIPYSVLTSQTSGSLWLTASPSSGNTTSNANLTVSANASGLSVSSTPYTGTVTITPSNGDNYSIVINVSLTVTSATSAIYAAPAQLLFSYETTQSATLQPQVVQLTSAGTLGFTVTASTMGGSNCPNANWLQVTPNSNVTPASLTINAVTSGMTAGFCTGTVQVTYNNGSSANTTTLIQVVVDIASTPLLTVTPSAAFGVVTATFGSTSIITSQISLGSTDGSPLGYSAFAATPNSPLTWLSLGNSEGNTQQFLQVQIYPAGLPIGVYNGSITISANNSATLPSGSLVIPVVLTVSANTTVVASPTSLSFTQSQGATTAPAAQTVSLTANGGSTGFTASVSPVTGGSWLQVSPSSGTATGSISASVAVNTLSQGTYTSQIVIKFVNAATPTITIPVSLTITAAQATVAASPTSLTFTYQLGGTTPATQQINVTSSSGAVPVTVSTTSTPAWLSATPASGTTGLGVITSVNTSVLTTAGTYTGTVTITPTGGGPAVTVPATITVTGIPAPQPTTISNSASGTFGVISPGELITIKGTNLGPATSATFTVGSGGTLSNALSGVQVLFDTIPGTPIYVSPTQINVIVPYEIAGRQSTSVSVSYSGQQSGGIQQTVANQAPGIYTDSSTGGGQASVLNQNGTLNGPSAGIVVGGQNISTSPAAEGSVIAVFMTGGGQTSPASTTGTVTPGGTTLYRVQGTVSATINGVNAPVQFAGAAPGEVTGVIQVNLLVPTGVSGSALPLTITINGSTASGPTVAVQ
jgi:uncharacterized protein (TIGR03437 family)